MSLTFTEAINCCLPQMLMDVEMPDPKRLVLRFKSGLVVEIQLADVEPPVLIRFPKDWKE